MPWINEIEQTQDLSDLATSDSITGRDWRLRDIGFEGSQWFDEDPSWGLSETCLQQRRNNRKAVKVCDWEPNRMDDDVRAF